MSRKVAIIGAGYVGLPLAQVFTEAGNSVILLDVSAERVAMINRGESYIEDVPSELLAKLVAAVRDARMPDDLPVLYGDGHAAERIAGLLAGLS